jgi:hypothetical protein
MGHLLKKKFALETLECADFSFELIHARSCLFHVHSSWVHDAPSSIVLFHAGTSCSKLDCALPCWHMLFQARLCSSMLAHAVPILIELFHACTCCSKLNCALPCWHKLFQAQYAGTCCSQLNSAVPSSIVLFHAGTCCSKLNCALPCWHMLFQAQLCSSMLAHAVPSSTVLF